MADPVQLVQSVPGPPLATDLSGSGTFQEDPKEELKVDGYQDDSNINIHMSGIDDSEDANVEWQNGHANGGGENHYDDLAVEPEFQGTGIKEDG